MSLLPILLVIVVLWVISAGIVSFLLYAFGERERARMRGNRPPSSFGDR